MSRALYRKYRSRSLDEILGQDHVTNVLRSALEKGKISHAYLLTGPRGTGKTSVARILAHEINKLPYKDEEVNLDIIEIDAASNTGVDNIRELREKAQIAPVATKYKVYIIDEVHMLSKPAFNALLKILEEPPEHIVFILATTDVDKLPSTIISRVQQYYFKPINSSVIARQLSKIAESEGFKINDDAAKLIADRSRGGFRDSLSLLDQLSSLASDSEPLTREQVSNSIGLADEQSVRGMFDARDSNDSGRILELARDLEEDGHDPIVITRQLLSIAREELPGRPDYTGLIRGLISVTNSPHPDLKLLTVLLDGINTGTAPTRQSTASTSETPKPTAPKIATPKGEEPSPATKPEPKPASVKKETNPVKVTKKEAPKIQATTEPVKPFDGEFDWGKLSEEARKKSMGLYSLIAKCDHDFENGVLTIYAGTAFAKKKLEDAKNRPLVSEVARKSQGADIPIEIKSGKKPPSDSKLAAVADMMGGGEEVSLEEIS